VIPDPRQARRARRVLVGAAGLVAIVVCASIYDPKPKADGVEVARVIDGDTFELEGGERVRLNGVDTVEAPGHCRPGRKCVEGNWELARFNLAYALRFGDLDIERVKTDRYGRTVAQVRAGTLDVSCYMLRSGNAAYVERWDEGLRTKTACPELAR
jgi:micrococcal nuclease